MTDDFRLAEMPFDLYERYLSLEHIGRLFRTTCELPYSVLDVGGHSPVLRPGFSSIAEISIPGSRVTVVDTIPRAWFQNYVQANGMQLPFRDGAFDLVCSLDTLEHIPAEHRPAFLSELLRVTRDVLYLAFPFKSANNRWAESMVGEYADAVLRDPIPGLLEHRRFGLPDAETIARLFVSYSYPWISFQQGNSEVWSLMTLTSHTLRTSAKVVKGLNRRFNQVYAAGDSAEPHYRAGYLLSKRRSIADLEAAAAAFGSAGKKTDLQSVLALCQLFLRISQNGREAPGKDGHIRNIENELAGLPVSEEKLDEAVAAVSQSSEMGSLLKQMQKQIDSLQSRVEFSIGMDERMRDLEIGLATNKRAIQAIYHSRIWKAFCKLGALVLRLSGRPIEGDSGASPWRNAKLAETIVPTRQPEIGDEFVALTCDYPGDRQILPVKDIVEIRGWVLAKSGIERVLIQVNDEPPVAASYGILRPDVARKHPQFIDADHSGYRFFWDTAGLPEGLCTVRITAEARNGQTRETVCKVRIDLKTPPDYGLWITRHEPTPEALRQIRHQTGNLTVRPLISIAVPVYKTPAVLLTKCIESVLEQTYPNWELCLVDDGSNDRALTTLLQKFSQDDSRIRVVALEQNRGIAAATNEALRLTTGAYVGFLDHDDELAGFALAEVVHAINGNPDTEIFYSDEDKIDERGRRYDAFFKPDWSPDLFRSCNYICHFVVMKRRLLERLGGLDDSYSGAQDYEFLLRASERTQEIQRIPKILYHWRAIHGSAAKGVGEKPEASWDGERALKSHLDRTSPGAQVEEVGVCRYRVRYPTSSDPRVSILMPTGGHKNVFRALEDVLEKTAYKNYEILLIDNSRTTRVKEYVSQLAARKAPVQYVDWRGKPFNFSRMNNEVARIATSPYLLFLNDDTSIITAEWLTAMLEHAQRPEIGAVGAQLWYPNNLIQHAGVVMGIFSNCSHAFKGLQGGESHYFDFPNLIRNCSAVTGACLLVGRQKFFEAGAFDEVNLAVAFQDVDLCLKLLELGYRNVYTPYAKLYHYESATKTEKDKIPDPTEDSFVKKKWARYIADDPCYNPNLARRKEDYSLALE